MHHGDVVAIDGDHQCYVTHATAFGIATFEEKEVARTHFVALDRCGVLALCCSIARQFDVKLGVEVGDVSGAIHRPRRRSAIAVGLAEEGTPQIDQFVYDRCLGFFGRSFLRGGGHFLSVAHLVVELHGMFGAEQALRLQKRRG